jgi:hypothetical protein
LKIWKFGFTYEVNTSLYVYNSIIYIEVGFMGIRPMFSCISKGFYSPKACPLGLDPILKAIIKNKFKANLIQRV